MTWARAVEGGVFLVGGTTSPSPRVESVTGDGWLLSALTRITHFMLW